MCECSALNLNNSSIKVTPKWVTISQVTLVSSVFPLECHPGPFLAH